MVYAKGSGNATQKGNQKSGVGGAKGKESNAAKDKGKKMPSKGAIPGSGKGPEARKK